MHIESQYAYMQSHYAMLMLMLFAGAWRCIFMGGGRRAVDTRHYGMVILSFVSARSVSEL